MLFISFYPRLRLKFPYKPHHHLRCCRCHRPGTKKSSPEDVKAMPASQHNLTTTSHSTSADAVDHTAHLKWWTDAEETAVRKKLDWNILPMLYVQNILDFSLLLRARTLTLNHEHLTIQIHHLRCRIHRSLQHRQCEDGWHANRLGHPRRAVPNDPRHLLVRTFASPSLALHSVD